MPERRVRVYCSGPIFNESERDEMLAIANALERAGFEPFLPQRDGLEFTPLANVLTSRGASEQSANDLWAKAIFALDVYQAAKGCDVAVVNLNGRVPDEGCVSEAALAWSAGKIVVGIKDDVRSLYFGRDNPLVAGLFGFRIHAGIHSAIEQINEELNKRPLDGRAFTPSGQMADILALGEKLADEMKRSGDLDRVAGILMGESI